MFQKFSPLFLPGSVALLILLLSACGDKSSTTTPTPEDQQHQSGQAEKPAVEAPKKLEPTQDVALDDPAIENLAQARIETSFGDITIVLFHEQSPISVANFTSYVERRHYVRSVFHRIIPNFMIQGGGFSNFYEQRKTQAPIAYEGNNGLSNQRGTIAMARTNDPNSATAQWFINHKDNISLDHGTRGRNVAGYTVFGRVISGMNIVDAIANAETGEVITPAGQTLANAPLKPILIEKVVLIK